MNKAEFVAAVATRMGGSKKDAAVAVDSVLDEIVQQLAAGEKVEIKGFGTFENHYRAARTGHNPRNMEPVAIPEVFTPRFKWAKAFRDAVNHKPKTN